MRSFEDVPKVKLNKDNPVVVRVDGKAFRTFTKGMKEPYDDIFKATMQQTMMDLCAAIPSCIYAYSFSDEISMILCGNERLGYWHEFEVEKIVSCTASLATMFFNKHFHDLALNYEQKIAATGEDTQQNSKYINDMKRKMYVATFDSRAFNVPKEKIWDYLKFRQFDCIRNSVASMYRSVFGRAASVNKNKTLKEMNALLKEKGMPWSDTPSHQRLGCVCRKEPRQFTKVLENGEEVSFIRKKWIIPKETPNMTKQVPTELCEQLAL